MNLVSINARTSIEVQATSEMALFLFKITHPKFAEPIRLSTDPTKRLSNKPPRYGTLSTWLTDDGSPFHFMVADALLPSDQADAPPASQVVINLLDSRIMKLLRSTTRDAEVDMAVVRVLKPDVPEFECYGLGLVGFNADIGRVVLSLSRLRLKGEPSPAHRMNREYFPAMFR
jgi:hypothetical protein